MKRFDLPCNRRNAGNKAGKNLPKGVKCAGNEFWSLPCPATYPIPRRPLPVFEG